MTQQVEKYTIRLANIEDEINRIKDSGLSHDEAISYANSFSIDYENDEVKSSFIKKINELYESK